MPKELREAYNEFRCELNSEDDYEIANENYFDADYKIFVPYQQQYLNEIFSLV